MLFISFKVTMVQSLALLKVMSLAFISFYLAEKKFWSERTLKELLCIQDWGVSSLFRVDNYLGAKLLTICIPL